MSVTVSPENLGAELAELLTRYGEDTVEATKKAIDDTADELVADLTRDSPEDARRRKRKYKPSWRKKTQYEDRAQKRVTVHNLVYQLTHLLENGHAKANGGRVAARVHIAPNEEKAKTTLVQRIEEGARR